MVMRITGMSSGLDIDKIISDLMRVEKLPQTKLVQKQTLIKYEADMYREINTKMSALRESLNSVRYSSTMTGIKSTSSSGAVSVSSNAVAATGTKTINVTQLAKAAEVSGTNGVTSFGLEGNTVNFPVEIAAGNNDKFVITLDNSAKVITLPEGSYNLESVPNSDPDGAPTPALRDILQTSIDAAFGKNKINVSLNGDRLVLDPVEKAGYKPQIILNDNNGALAELGFDNGQMYRLSLNTKISTLSDAGKFSTPLSFDATNDFTVNGVTISYTEDDTLQSIMTKVNGSSAGVTMAYDSTNDAFVFKSRATGQDAQVDIKFTGNGNLLQALKVPDATSVGVNAEFTLDGVAYVESSNSFNKDGIAYKLNQATGEDITITLEADTEAVVEKLKSFATAYNDLIELVNKRLAESKSRGYAPLTADQKSEMKESDIALWDAEVKKGLLGNSAILNKIKTSLREMFSKTIDGASDEFNALSAIGITTVPYVRGVTEDAGKITIDENKLKDALLADPGAVNRLLTHNTGVESQDGFMVTMYSRVDGLISELINKAGRVGSSNNDRTVELGRRFSDLQTKIESMDFMLFKKEANYFRRFSAMETAIANSNATMNWLAAQFTY